MAKQKLINYGETQTNNIDNDLDKGTLEIRKRKQMEQMDGKIKELAQKAIEFYDLYGAEDYRYQMMVTFLDVAFQMKDAIALISAVEVATSYLSTAIQFIDDSIQYQDQFNKQMLSTNYGLFARWKRKREMRKAARNNRHRLETAIKGILMRVEMAHEITDSLRVGFENMRYSMAKSDAKRRKKEAKRAKKSGVPVPTQERALRYIDEVRGTPTERPSGASAPAGSASGASAPAAASSPAPEGGTTTRGIDDIL